MYKRRAFLHWYIGEGMDEQEVCSICLYPLLRLIIMTTVRGSGEQRE